jgi:hypothetical protein
MLSFAVSEVREALVILAGLKVSVVIELLPVPEKSAVLDSCSSCQSSCPGASSSVVSNWHVILPIWEALILLKDSGVSAVAANPEKSSSSKSSRTVVPRFSDARKVQAVLKVSVVRAVPAIPKDPVVSEVQVWFLQFSHLQYFFCFSLHFPELPTFREVPVASVFMTDFTLATLSFLFEFSFCFVSSFQQLLLLLCFVCL